MAGARGAAGGVTIPPIWRASSFPAPAMDRIDRTLGDALLDQARARPDQVAVIDGAERYSFADLARRAGGLADQLRGLDAPAGPVAAIQPMGIDMVAGWFACAAAGRPLCLLDPQNPPARNHRLALRSDASIVLHDGRREAWIADAGLLSVIPDRRAGVLEAGGGLAADAPLMILPTSGSTGDPKLVVHSARTLQARVQASIGLMGIHPGDRVLIAGAHGNFGFLHHALTFLLAGGTLCLFDLPGGGLAGLAGTIAAAGVRHMRFTPSLFRQAIRLPELAGSLRQLNGLRFSGEALLASDVLAARAATAPTCRIQNVYGSTESALFLWSDDRSTMLARGAAPIGQPYPLWSYALADATPDGAGHLIVRSGYQALGDWSEGAIRVDRFPSDPDHPELRRYETGDVVRLAGGDLVALERRDQVAKIAGQRVSLVEIGDCMRQMPGCADAAVLVVDGSLAAFMAGDPQRHRPADVRNWLAQRLPRHMVPGRIRVVAELPLLPGGKVDSVALRRLPVDDGGADRTRSGDGVDQGWTVLERVWAKALDRPDAVFDAASDFFDEGGDSLRLLNLRAALDRHALAGFDLPRFLERPTLAALAKQVGLTVAASTEVAAGAGVPRFRLVRPALQRSRGIALVMPGRSGAAVTHPWVMAGALPDHDIWACDMDWPTGHMLQKGRWIDAAQAIAAALAAGRAPRATLLLGFSIAGYIAWLVDRSLARTPVQPDRLILLDPAPMHRRIGPHRLRLAALLARTGRADPPAVLLIRRCKAGTALMSDVARAGWTATDSTISEIVVSTVDHADMNTRVVLQACAPAMAGYLDDGRSGRVYIGGIDSISGRLSAMLSANAAVDPDEIDAIIAAQAQIGSLATLSATLYVAIAHGRADQVRRAIAALAAVEPQLPTHRLAAAMLAREERFGADLARGGRPYMVLENVTSIRHAFGLRGRSAGRADTGAVHLAVLRAMMLAQFLRLRCHNLGHRLSRIAGR